MDLRLRTFSSVPPSLVRAPLALNAPLLRCPRPNVRTVGSAARTSTSTSTTTSASAVSTEKEILEKGKGWTDARGVQDERILNRFHQLTTLASDRVEMHKILAGQRDNWNHLFHSTITIASVSAASVLAMSSQVQAPGLTIVATILNAACAALMTLVNVEQPSQLAEEQRRAARFFRRLRVEVEATLKIDPQLREDASAYWEGKVGTLHALDEAFPLPLTPNGLEKFPKRVVPAELSPDPDEIEVGENENQVISSMRASSCKWTPLTETYVKQLIARIAEKDVPELIEIAETAKLFNLWSARISPVLAGGSAVINGLVCAGILSSSDQVSWLVSSLTVLAFVTHSFSHALQLGSLFEVYRTAAGYYLGIQKSVERALELPRQQREDWKLFLLKLNLKLGLSPENQVVSKSDHDADRFL